MDDAAVIVQEDALHIGVELHLRHLFQLIRAGELHVHHAAAVILMRIRRKCLLIGCQHPVKNAVANHVHRHLHARIVGAGNQRVQLLLGEDDQALLPRRVGIALAHQRRARAQGAVAQDLQRAHAELALPPAGVIALGEEILQALHGHELALLVDAHRQLARRVHFLIRLHHLVPIDPLEGQQIVRLGAGHAHAVELPAGFAHHPADFRAVRQGHAGERHGHGVVAEDAVGIAIAFRLILPALGLGLGAVQAQERERHGIDHQRMPAAAHDADGMLHRNRVQVMPRGNALFPGEVVLIPAAALHPLAGGDSLPADEVPQRILHIRQRGGMRRQVAAGHGGAVVEQMHMGVVEARADKPPAQVDHLVALLPQRQHLPIGAHGGKALALHREGLLQRQSTCENPAAHINLLHISPQRQKAADSGYFSSISSLGTMR